MNQNHHGYFIWGKLHGVAKFTNHVDTQIIQDTTNNVADPYLIISKRSLKSFFRKVMIINMIPLFHQVGNISLVQALAILIMKYSQTPL